jgi:signal transduction histidine kinase
VQEKYSQTAQKGTIRITTSIDKHDLVIFRLPTTAPGSPQGSREKIFNPFFTTKDVGKGTGMA